MCRQLCCVWLRSRKHTKTSSDWLIVSGVVWWSCW